METTITKKSIKQSVKSKTDNGWHLILWNDEVNDMMDIITALYQVCKLNKDLSYKIMLEAHTNGQAFAKSGRLKEIEAMQQALNDRNISVSVVKEDVGNN